MTAPIFFENVEPTLHFKYLLPFFLKYFTSRMGKRKSKVGMTGLSRFVAVLNEDRSNAQPALHSLELSLQSTGQTSEKEKEENIPAVINFPMSGNQVPAILTGSEFGLTLGAYKTAKNMSTRYDATKLAPFYNDVSEVPEHLKKYFSQRTRYFSLYDKPPGCLLDEEGWYSITPERIADQIAERCRCDVVLDAFCGVGGNTIAFAKTCERVIALDTNPIRLALARHNAQIYGVADRIEFIQADYLSFARSYLSRSSSSSNNHRKIDVVFLSPPWGGPSYLSGVAAPSGSEACGTAGVTTHPIYSLSSIQPIHGKALFALTRKITPNLAYYLPRNTDLSEISGLLNGTNEDGNTIRLPEEQVEIEEEWMGNKLKALTCYFAGLAVGQEHLF